MEDVQTIITAYIASAIVQGQSTENGDYKKGNKHYRVIDTCYKKLQSIGESAILELSKLLVHPDVGVRLWAAAHLLAYKAKDAEEVLRKIAEQPGLVAFTAEMTLREWKAGRLKF